jgi:hypothetical protein
LGKTLCKIVFCESMTGETRDVCRLLSCKACTEASDLQMRRSEALTL